MQTIGMKVSCAVLVALLLPPAIGAAQEAEFREATREHRWELSDLLHSRGGGFGEAVGSRDSSTSAFVTDYLGASCVCRVCDICDAPGLLFYSFSPDGLSVWLLTPRGITAFEKVDVQAIQLENAIHDLTSALAVDSARDSRLPQHRGFSRPARDGTAKDVTTAIATLTDLLLPGAVADSLAGVTTLIVVPAAGIGTVPFAVLQPFGSDSYLIDSMSVAIAPSLFDVFQDAPQWIFRPGSAVVVGNPSRSPTWMAGTFLACLEPSGRQSPWRTFWAPKP